MPIRLRDATPADWPGIAALLEGSHLPTAGFRESVSAAVVACEGDDVMGVAALEIYDEGALLRSVAVSEAARGQGVGQRLTNAALAAARARGVAQVFLLTTTAEAFFPRLGFERIDRANVPASVQASVEFKGACPASATAMARPIRSTD